MSDNQTCILLVEDDSSLRNLLVEELELEGYGLLSAGTASEAMHLFQTGDVDLVVSDLRLPDQSGLWVLRQIQASGHLVPFVIITAFGTVDQAVTALKAGADDFLTKPLSVDHLLLKIRRLLAHAEMSHELARYRSGEPADESLGLVGAGRAMTRLRTEVRQVARSQAVVLITGESGTGKELVARAIHRQSDRKDRPFIPVNCAGIPAELMESEFFGHEAGAFTSARQARKGLFAEADGGTLLLDEIGEMPLLLQAKLLRVLQEGSIKPVGADREDGVDVRVLAATHVDLQEAVREGRFREDLYYRLETLSLNVPPLRERAEDIELLVAHFLRDTAARQGKGYMQISEVALQMLVDYPFPGNVRELASAIERAVTFCEGHVIHPEHLPGRVRERQVVNATTGAMPPGSGSRPLAEWPTLESLQQDYVLRVIDAVEGNKRRAAQILGIDRRTLYRWLDSYKAGDQG